MAQFLGLCNENYIYDYNHFKSKLELNASYLHDVLQNTSSEHRQEWPYNKKNINQQRKKDKCRTYTH